MTEPSLPGYYQYFSGRKCVFAQGHNTAEVGIEPRPLAPESEALPLGHCPHAVGTLRGHNGVIVS